MAKEVVILGAGYAGILTALSARRELTAEAAHITVVNRVPFHQLITELHLPAVGNAPDEHVRVPLHKLFTGKRIDVVLGEIEQICPDEHEVRMAGGASLPFDILVVAIGSQSEYFGIPGLKEHSFTLKSVDEAQTIRNHIESCFEAYHTNHDAAELTFAVGGAGLTGIELIGELADAMPGLCKKFGIDQSNVKLLSVEAMPSILPGFSANLVERAKSSLEARGVQFLTGVPIVEASEGLVRLKDDREIHTRTMIWTGGVRGHEVVAQSGLAVDGRGRGLVNEHLQSASHPNVFVIGDSALVLNDEGRPYPPTAQLAWQMGEHVGPQIYALLKGGKLDVFHPHIIATLASLGRKDAIGLFGSKKLELTGKPAAWLKDASNLRYLFEIGGLLARA